MKTFNKAQILTLTLLLFISINIYAQPEIKKNDFKQRLTKIFNLSKSGNYKEAASLIAYKGRDKKRDYKDSYNYDNSTEAKLVKRMCKKINALLQITDDYYFGDLIQKSSGEFTFFDQSVIFNSGTQKLVTQFEFVLADGKFLLAKVN